MAERKTFLLRLSAETLDAMQRWARDDLRSLNAQIEFVLREALRARGRATQAMNADESAERGTPPETPSDGATGPPHESS